jgi:hypothetical protein
VIRLSLLPAQLAVLSVVVGVTGCSAPRATRPLAPSVDLVIEDLRPTGGEETQLGGVEALLWYWCPIIPWFQSRADYHLKRSMLEPVKEAVTDTGLFQAAYGDGDPEDQRQAAPYELRLTLKETYHGRVTSSYCLGLFAGLLHVLGAPSDYTHATVELELELVARDGSRPPHRGLGQDTDSGFMWIYEDDFAGDRRGHMREALHTALSEALAPLIEEHTGQGSAP